VRLRCCEGRRCCAYACHGSRVRPETGPRQYGLAGLYRDAGIVRVLRVIAARETEEGARLLHGLAPTWALRYRRGHCGSRVVPLWQGCLFHPRRAHRGRWRPVVSDVLITSSARASATLSLFDSKTNAERSP